MIEIGTKRNNIFVNPEIHDIYIKRIGFSLIRVHRFQSGRVLESTNNILLSQLKWPIETMYVGLRPAQNVAAANPNQYRDWHNLTLLTDQQLDCAAGAQGEVMTDDLIAFNAVSIKHKYFTSRVNNCAVVFPNSTETIDTLQLQAHGIQIFATARSAFYRDYLPYTFGGSNINTPEDKGALMLNFCLYPGTYQPSGHLNVSRARELYLEYVSSYVSQSSPADLLVLTKPGQKRRLLTNDRVSKINSYLLVACA
jgi:Large eukaryotic DNA virus major capsid protein